VINTNKLLIHFAINFHEFLYDNSTRFIKQLSPNQLIKMTNPRGTVVYRMRVLTKKCICKFTLRLYLSPRRRRNFPQGHQLR